MQMTLTDQIIRVLLMALLVFTPLARGSVDLWAFSTMEFGILLVIVVWAVGQLPTSSRRIVSTRLSSNTRHYVLPGVLVFLFVTLVTAQMIHLPSKMVEFASPKTYALRSVLTAPGGSLRVMPLSFFPLGTKIELMKWLTLSGLFFFLLNWAPLKEKDRLPHQLIFVLLLVGAFESLYGLFGHFGSVGEGTSGMGTFVNRNHFAGYLLMVIPVTIGFLFSREADRSGHFMSWRDRLSSLEGKSILISFAAILMILALIFSSSRMGIASLLASFSLIILLFKNPSEGSRFSKRSAVILGLAVLWGAWIGLDAVIGRFFYLPEDYTTRKMIWANTFQIIKDFPLFGSGLGTFTQVFPMHRSFHIRSLVTHAENDFLQLVSETGLVGLGLLVILFALLFYQVARGLRLLSQRDPKRYIAIGGLVSILALMFHSLVERNIQVPGNAFLWTLLMALVLRMSERVPLTPEVMPEE